MSFYECVSHALMMLASVRAALYGEWLQHCGETEVSSDNSVVDMVKSMHVKVPYFKIISWDIAINNNNSPIMVEYNTYNQGLDIQIPSGPLFGKYTDEILAKGLEPY